MTSARLMSAVAALATLAAVWTTPASALPVSGQGTWETTLQARDLNGDTITDAFYDTALNITWLRNANENGQMNWNDANTWANNLSFGGYTDWRLPTMVDTGTAGCNFSYGGGTDCGSNVQTATSEMAQLYYVTLANLALCSPGDAACAGGLQTGWGLTNTGDFQNMQSSGYWSGLEYVATPSDAWFFFTYDGSQGPAGKFNRMFALAVRPGDVAAAVPEPQSLALVLLGLVAAGVARRRRPL